MTTRDGTAAHRALAGLSIGLLLTVALARPNATKPDLGSGWPLDGVLPWAPSSGVVTALMWGAYAVAALAIAAGLRRPVPALRWAWVAGLGTIGTVAAPIGSGDVLNYAAYGRVLLMGGDPWVESPSAWAGGSDPIASAVEEPWRIEPSVYGPVATALHGLAAWVGGTDLRLVVLAWQVVVLLSWLGVRWLLRRLVGPDHHGRVDVLWTLNPFVVSAGLLGAHVDTVATLLTVAALVALRQWRGSAGIVAAGALVGLATGTKFTYAVVGLALVLTWVVPGVCGVAGRGGPLTCVRRIGLLAAGALPLLALVHLWAGPHVYDQLGRARSSVSLATPWRLVLETLRPELGGATTRSLISAGAAVLAIVLAVALARVSRPVVEGDEVVTAAWLTAVLTLAYSLAAPYTLPWYDVIVWAMAPAVVIGLVHWVLLGRQLVMAAAYVPGRVLGMTPEVEAVTLGFRREVAPWLQLVLWVVTLAVALRALVVSRSRR